MKRLLPLVLLLTPLALWGLARSEYATRSHHLLRPWISRDRHQESTRAETLFEVEVRGYPKATPERARVEAEHQLQTALADWFEKTGLPRSWAPPRSLVAPLVQTHEIERTNHDYGSVYVQPATLMITAEQRDQLVMAYERELAGHRLVLLGVVLAFILVCLALLAGYIHIDEATRGYYTNYLRAAAITGVGLAGVVLVRILS